MIEKTLAIIKPDGVEKGIIGEIIGGFETNGLKIVALKMSRLTKSEAEAFYSVHKSKPFFNSLTRFMSSGPVVVMVLEGVNAIKRNRDLMGSTDPKEAGEGTIRRLYGTDIEKNVVHGSDGPVTAKFEISFFFSESELS